MFLRVFGDGGRKGVQGRGVGERVNPLPRGVLITSLPLKGSTDFLDFGVTLGSHFGRFW